jgi:hypothetical protein
MNNNWSLIYEINARVYGGDLGEMQIDYKLNKLI